MSHRSDSVLVPPGQPPPPQELALRHDFQGRLAEVGPAQDGVRHGLWRRFHADGTLAERGTYLRGTRHGLWRSWYNNGSIYTETMWLRGTPAHTWSYYLPGSSTPYLELTFDNGELEKMAWEGDERREVMYRNVAFIQ